MALERRQKRAIAAAVVVMALAVTADQMRHAPPPVVESNQRPEVATVRGPSDLVIDVSSLLPIDSDGTFRLGVTHISYLKENGRRGLHEAVAENNQFIMGFGIGNPEPAPGARDLAELDRGVDRMRATGRPISITLCCAPDWMKGGAYGETDFDRINEAPLPQYYDEFAELSAAVAARYPDVESFQVWSELRGFFDAAKNRWDYEAYTELYNQVYDAIKEVRPDARVGGPYVVMDSWAEGGSHPSQVSGPWGTLDQRPLDVLEYWLRYAHGADFVSVDGRLGTKDDGWIVEPLDSLAKADAVLAWLRERTDLPVQWAELYVVPHGSPLDQEQRTAVVATAAIRLAAAGADGALLWGVDATRPAVDTPLIDSAGKLTVAGKAVSLLQSLEADAGRRRYADDRLHEIAVFANDDHVVLVDLSGEARVVSVGRTTVELQPWEVLRISR